MVKYSNITLLKTLLLGSFISCHFAFAYDSDDFDDNTSTTSSTLSEHSPLSNDTLNRLPQKEGALTLSPTDALKEKIKPYINSVFKIKFHSSMNNESSGHTGTGWMLDAANGIIATNHHVVPNNLAGSITIEIDNGEEYTSPEVEILQTTVGQQFGDFSFLRVKKLINKNPKAQIPIARVFNAKKHDTLAFMGNSYGSFTVEVGNINDARNYWEQEDVLGCMSVSVDLHARGGASGSPVFDKNGEAIGILFAGDDVHNMILPITYINKAYEQLKAGQRITAVSFGTPFQPEKIHELSRYHHIPLETLKKYIRSKDDEFKLMVAQPITQQKPTENQLEQNDILLTVDGEKIGTDQIRLIELLEQSPTHKVKVLRKGEVKKLMLPTVTFTQSFSKTIDIDGTMVVSADSSLLDRYNLEPDTALLNLSLLGYLKITGIHKTDVVTFNDFVHALIEVRQNQKLETFFLYATSCSGTIPTAIPIDLRGIRGKSLYVTFMNEITHQWEHTDYLKYTTPVAAPSAPQTHQPRGRKRGTQNEAGLKSTLQPPKKKRATKA